MTKDKLYAYIQLTRFDKPVGIELLLWPTLWAVFLAALGAAYGHVNPDMTIAVSTAASISAAPMLPSLSLLIIFTLGAILMRAAGCAINDFADRKVDGSVARTQGRPLADGRLSGREAIAAFTVLSLLSASLLLWLPHAVFYWSFGALLLAFIYPFMKRFTYLPQVFLAAAFGWAIPMAYVAVQGVPDRWCWLLFAAYMCWTIAYDTQYAMADRADDLKIGVKSTAILFGRFDVLMIAILQTVFLILMGLVLAHYFSATVLGLIPVYGLGLVALLFAQQNKACATRQPAACLQAFLANVWVGRYLFLLIAGSCVWAALASS